MSISALVYDCEIKKAITFKDDKIPGIEYCQDFTDFTNMGISVVGAFDYLENRYRVFSEQELPEFQALVYSRKLLIGFNNIKFDNPLLTCSDVYIPESKCYDILKEVWAAAGFGPEFNKDTHSGYGLDATYKANFPNRAGKSGNGAFAPVWWQQGLHAKVIDYCLQDVKMTHDLFDLIIHSGGHIANPKNPHAPLKLVLPYIQ